MFTTSMFKQSKKTIFAFWGIIAAVLLFSTYTLFAQENEHATHANSEGEEEAQFDAHEVSSEKTKFNAGELIVEHISDAYDWHLWGHLSIPLPVIIKTDKGFDVFSSSRFEHGHATYQGNYTYKLVKGHVKIIDENGQINEEATANAWDISITKNVAAIIVTMLLMCWMFLSVAKMYKRNPNQAPKGVQSFVEPLIVFVRDEIAKAAIGEKKHTKYLPFLLTVFFFIWISNLLGLIPVIAGANVTGNIAVALVLAGLVFLITIFSGNANYWKHVVAMPGVPVGVLFILTPIEIISLFLKPFVLMIRLFANIMAGHIIALSFFSLIFIFAEMNVALGWGVSLVSILFTVFMGMLELLVAFLQAYVFTLLSAMYFGAAVEEHHQDHH